MTKKRSPAQMLARFTLASTGVVTPPQEGQASPATPSTSRFFSEDMSAEEAAEKGMLREIAIDVIDPDPTQPRKVFDAAALQTLADAIQAAGRVIQPPGVRPNPLKPDRYMLVWGERRWRACKLLGKQTITVAFDDTIDNTKARVLQLIENSEYARENVRPIDEAESIAELVKIIGKPVEVSRILGVSRGHISKRMDLANLPAQLRTLMKSGQLGDYETALALEKLSTRQPAAYAEMVAEAEGGAQLGRQRVLAALRAAKLAEGGAANSNAPSPELMERVGAIKARYANVLASKRLGGAKVCSLELSGTNTARGRPAKLLIEFKSWSDSEQLLAQLESLEPSSGEPRGSD